MGILNSLERRAEYGQDIVVLQTCQDLKSGRSTSAIKLVLAGGVSSKIP